MNVLINGIGRIGKALILQNLKSKIFNLYQINDFYLDLDNLIYLLKNDSTYDHEKYSINKIDKKYINLENKNVLFSNKDIGKLDLKKIDLIIDSSGAFHSKKVFDKIKKNNVVYIATNDLNKFKSIVYGVNHKDINIKQNKFYTSSICDVVSLAPIFQTLNNKFSVESGNLTTLHPWLSYQKILDSKKILGNKDGFQLGRSSINNLILKDTTAIKSLSKIFKGINKKIQSVSFRVPTNIVTCGIFSFRTKKKISIDIIKRTMINFANKNPEIIKINYDNLVSSDYKKIYQSAIIDMNWIKKIDKNTFQIIYWYDNEWGYSNKIISIIKYIKEKNSIWE